MQLKKILLMSSTLALTLLLFITPMAAAQVSDTTITAAEVPITYVRNVEETVNHEEITIPTTEPIETIPAENEEVKNEPIKPIISIPEEAVSFIETENENASAFEYEGLKFVVPHLSSNREPQVTESGYTEKITEVPHYFQSFYPNTRYGDSNLRKSGCGITCVSMVFSYLLDQEIMPDVLAEQYTRYKVDGGSSWTLFPDSAEDYGITIEAQVFNWDEVVEALKNGHVVIANPSSPSIFTDGGHFIVLFGITEDGKILVRDPNLYNYSIWTSDILKNGFAEGFDEKSLKYSCFPCWIYQLKDLDTVAARAEIQETETDPV